MVKIERKIKKELFMTRREFLVAAGALAAVPSLEVERQETIGPTGRDASAPRYFVWTGRASDEELKNRYRILKARGMTGVFLDGYHQPDIEAINEAGLEAHIWMWTTNRGDAWIREHHPDWYMVARTGESCFDQPPYVDYYRWVSPVIPGVRNYLKEKVDELASKEGVAGVHLDYVRYPDVILPRDLWETYGLDQTEELPRYDFCYSDHTCQAFKELSGRDPRQIEHPSRDQEWIAFRQQTVTTLVAELASTIRGKGKEVTAAVFPTPSLARKICRQDWDKWSLDLYLPMIYHSFYRESVNWIGDCVRENIQATMRPMAAGLYMPAFKDPKELSLAMSLVHLRGGVGVSLFGNVSDEMWSAFEEARWA